jgi:hypothetical protein
MGSRKIAAAWISLWMWGLSLPGWATPAPFELDLRHEIRAAEEERTLVQAYLKSNLPVGANVDAILYALFEGTGEESARYVSSTDGKVMGEGELLLAFEPIRMFPGRYRIKIEIDPDYQEPEIQKHFETLRTGKEKEGRKNQKYESLVVTREFSFGSQEEAARQLLPEHAYVWEGLLELKRMRERLPDSLREENSKIDWRGKLRRLQEYLYAKDGYVAGRRFMSNPFMRYFQSARAAGELALALEESAAETTGKVLEDKLAAWDLRREEAVRSFGRDAVLDGVMTLDRLRREMERYRLELSSGKGYPTRAADWTARLDALERRWKGFPPFEETDRFMALLAAVRRAAPLYASTETSQEVLDKTRTGMLQVMGKIEAARSTAGREAKIRVDPAARSVEIDGYVCVPEGLVELFACAQGGKEYESVMALYALPQDIHLALLLLNYKDGLPPQLEAEGMGNAHGDLLDVFVRWEEGGQTRQLRAEELLIDAETGKPVSKRFWVFLGSEFYAEPDPVTGEPVEVYAANVTGTVITTFFDPTAILHTTSAHGFDDTMHLANGEVLPESGTPITLRIQAAPKEEVAVLMKTIRQEREVGKGLPPEGVDLEKERRPK